MSKSTLTPPEIQLTRKIMRNLNALKQIEIAKATGQKISTNSHRLRNFYPDNFPTFLKLIDMAGYELVEKEL